MICLSSCIAPMRTPTWGVSIFRGMRCANPATARLRRGSPLTTLQTTKRQPAAGTVERGGRGKPGKQRLTHAGDALRQLTMHISTNDLHCCKPACLLQLARSRGRPRRRLPATALKSRQSVFLPCIAIARCCSSRAASGVLRALDVHLHEAAHFRPRHH